MHYETVSTQNAKMKLAEPQNFFKDYPKLVFDFFKILLERMPETTMPIDFMMRYEISLDDLKYQPNQFGNVGIFIMTMRPLMKNIATELFDEAFGNAVQEVCDLDRAQSDQSVQ